MLSFTKINNIKAPAHAGVFCYTGNMEKWLHPPIIKIYEALGSVADDRITVEQNTAKVFSSSGNKFYSIIYDPEANAITSNDNGSFWKGYLGYPAIAFLMKLKVLPYENEIGELLKDMKWKDINQRFKNDFEKTLEFILSSKADGDRKLLEQYAATIDSEIKKLKINKLTSKVKPPEGY